MSQGTNSSKSDHEKDQQTNTKFLMGDQGPIDMATFEEEFANKVNHYKETKDKLPVLRRCISLLNNLEGTIHKQFAGKVLLFLAQVMPLFDKSGLNFLSNFSSKELPPLVRANLKKISEQRAQKDKHTTNGTDQDMEEGETISDDESDDSGPKVDTNRLYERFWRVQELLSSPNNLYDKNTWFTFRTYVDTLICRFEASPATIHREISFPYVKEPEAFALQLDDVNMRKEFLVQLLIVLQYLEHSIQPDTRSKGPPLDKVQLSWSSSMQNRIYAILHATPNSSEGREFVSLVKNILHREKMWVRWKIEKFSAPKKIQTEPVSMRSTYHRKRKISDELKSAKNLDIHLIGSPDMSRLWNSQPTEKFGQPDLLKYIDIPPEKQVEKFKDPNYSFRVLRLLRKNPHFFEQTSATIQSLDLYLKTTTGRIQNNNRN